MKLAVCIALSCMFDTLATILARDFPNTYAVLSSVYVRMGNKVGEGGVMRWCSTLTEYMHGETHSSPKTGGTPRTRLRTRP